MGEITERLPAPQYDQQQQMVKRTRSQPQSQLEVIDDSASAKLQTASKQKLEVVTRNDTSQTPKQTSTLQLSGNTHVEVESKSLI